MVHRTRRFMLGDELPLADPSRTRLRSLSLEVVGDSLDSLDSSESGSGSVGLGRDSL